MKHVRKIFAFAMALFMALAFVSPAFADTGSITINNSAKGETYSIYKLFGATNSTATTSNGESYSIAYTGDIPSTLSQYFTKDATTGEITATAAAKDSNGELSEGAKAALKTWAENQTATDSKPGTGGALVFDNIEQGYYVVTTTQGQMGISVDSTNPNAVINDKNTTTPINNPTKTVDDNNVFFGQTVNYTVSFGTANYNGTKKIVKYIITDNFANGALDEINVTSIRAITTNDQGEPVSTTIATQQFSNGSIEIAWVDSDGNSLYDNGATLELKYSAKIKDTAVVAGDGNTNTVGITYEDDDPTTPNPDPQPASVTVYTYAFAIKKTDPEGRALAGAKFKLPFDAENVNGVWVYKGEKAEGTIAETPANGLIVVKGVEQRDYTIEETEAPQGYNKLAAPTTVTAKKDGATTYYFNSNGAIVDTVTEGGFSVPAYTTTVQNQKGVEMPSTGGIGTTIFYIVGGVMVAGAVVFLLTKRRAAAAE